MKAAAEASATGGRAVQEAVLLKMEDIVRIILSYASALDVKRATCVCRRWNDLITKTFHIDLTILVVTVSGTNELALVSTMPMASSSIAIAAIAAEGNKLTTNSEGNKTTPTTTSEIVQRFTAGPSRRKRKRSMMTRQRSNGVASYCWPTCTALGPDGQQLFVSQYKIQGILEFKRSMDGFKYQRTLISSPSLQYPEGLVVAHKSIYAVSVSNGTVSRIALDRGQILEQAVARDFGSTDDWVLWGMCISPDHRSLYIAGHFHDETVLDYRLPTSVNSGRILRLNLEPDGSFEKTNEGLPRGYWCLRMGYLADEENNNSSRELDLQLNRPTNPVFCRHGILHVSSFISQSHGSERRIYKMFCPQQEQVPNLGLGYLQDDLGTVQQEGTTPGPWGVAFSNKSDEVFATCSKTKNQSDSSSSLDAQNKTSSSCLLKLSTCGCCPRYLEEVTTNPMPRRMRQFSTDLTTPLVRSDVFDQPNYVISI